MEQIRVRDMGSSHIKNSQARLSFVAVFFAYCLVAVFSSVPLTKTAYPRDEAALPAKAKPHLNEMRLDVAKNLQQPVLSRQKAQLIQKHTAWWRQHTKLPLLGQAALVSRDKLQLAWWRSHLNARSSNALIGETKSTTNILKADIGKSREVVALTYSAFADLLPVAFVDDEIMQKTALEETHGYAALADLLPVREEPARVLAAALPEPDDPATLMALSPEFTIPVRTVSKNQPDALIGPKSQLADWIGTDGFDPAKISSELSLEARVRPVFALANPVAWEKQGPLHPPAQCFDNSIAGWSGETMLGPKVVRTTTNELRDTIDPQLLFRLARKGFTPGAPVFIRIIKDQSLLEIWLKKGERFALFDSFKICRWSGSFGPKLYEGDKQSPEGFYRVDRHLFNRPSWKWKNSFSIGYPNAYDKLHGRTGSLILVHGGCTSSGCFAMTDPVIDELHSLARLARENGQKNFLVHVMPFPLTTANLRKHKNSPWLPFWKNIKQGYDLFETTGLPPKVRVCDKQYVFDSAVPGTDKASRAGQKCYGLAARIPGWKPASSRLSSKQRRQRRWSRKGRAVGVGIRCNRNLPSCRRWVSLQRRKKARQRRIANRKARMRRSRTIGKRRAKKSAASSQKKRSTARNKPTSYKRRSK